MVCLRGASAGRYLGSTCAPLWLVLGLLFFHCYFLHPPYYVNSYFSFSRVRALPSENWHEIADQMFCHPHEDDVPDTCRLLSPGSGDCFVGERHLVLREEDMSWRGAVRGSRGTVTCTRCHVVLGKIRGNVMCDVVYISSYIYIYISVRNLGCTLHPACTFPRPGARF